MHEVPRVNEIIMMHKMISMHTPFGPTMWICCTWVLFRGTFATTIVSLGIAFLMEFFPVRKEATPAVAKPRNFQN